MAVISDTEPKGGREIVHKELARRCDGRSGARSLCGTVQTGSPLAVYVIGHEDVTEPSPLSHAKPYGWRYPVVGDEAVGLALLRKTKEGLVYAGLTEGEFVDRLMHTAVLAEKHFGEHKGTFRARLLEIPSLHMCVLWLYAPRGKSSFSMIRDDAEGTDILIDDDIERHIRAAVELRARHAEAARPSITCTFRLPDAFDAERRAEVHAMLTDAIAPVTPAIRVVENGDNAPRRVAVFDASGPNAAALIEMGACQTRGEPAVLIIDDESGRGMDLRGVAHLVYPRDLRYGRVVAFQAQLAAALSQVLAPGEPAGNARRASSITA